MRSLIAVVVGSLILRLASQTTGWMLQFYFNRINENYYSLSHEVRGLVTASFFIAELLGSLALGALSDRYGRRPFILLGPIFGIVAVQLTSVTTALWLLVLTRLLEGLSTASSVPATLGYISDATDGRPTLRARIVGLFELTLVGGFAFGSSVAGYIWTYFERPRMMAGISVVSPAFVLNGGIYLLSLFAFYVGLRDIRPGRATASSSSSNVTSAVNNIDKFAHYKKLLRSKTIWTFIPAWLSIFSIVGMWQNSSPSLFTGNRHYQGQLLTGGLGVVRLGNGTAALAIFFALGILGWSFVLGGYRKTSVMLLSTVGLFATVLTVFGLNHVEMRSTLHFFLLGSLLIEVLIVSGFTPAALTYLADVSQSFIADRGSIMGLYSVFLGIGQLIGTAAGGVFAEWNGIDGLLILTGIFSTITAISLLILRRSEVPPAVIAQT